MASKLASYLRFIIGGIRSESGAGAFLVEEIRTKTQRLNNARVRRRFDAAKASDYRTRPCGEQLDALDVFSLCHGGGTPEQKLSILSFLRHVGTPRAWRIVSDGSITTAQADSLRALDPCIDVLQWDTFLCDDNRALCEEFIKYTMFAKKLALESNLPVDRATIYTDSDVLFFEGGHQLRHLLKTVDGKTYYQQDLPGFLDASLLTDVEMQAPPLNAGFVVQGRRIDWSMPIKRLEIALSHLTRAQKSVDLEKLEQAITHVAHVTAGSQPLDARYVLQVSDRLDDIDAFAGAEFVMRHYTRPVRHKMWLHASDYLP